MFDKSKSIKGCFTSVPFDWGFCFIISSLVLCRKFNIYGQELGQSLGMNKSLQLFAGDRENFRTLNMKQTPLQWPKWPSKASISKEGASPEFVSHLGSLSCSAGGAAQEMLRVKLFDPQSHCPSLGVLFVWHPLDLLLKLMAEITLIGELRNSTVHWILSAWL